MFQARPPKPTWERWADRLAYALVAFTIGYLSWHVLVDVIL